MSFLAIARVHGRKLPMSLFGLSMIACAVALPARAEDKPENKPAAKSAFTDQQKDQFGQLVREYLIAHPEVIDETMRALQVKRDGERDQKVKVVLKERQKELFTPKEGTVIGNPKGNVTIVEFFDYNCGYCKSMAPDLASVVQTDGKIRVVLKEYPILGPNSTAAAKAALASRKQGKYAEFHEALIGAKGSLSEDLIMSTAKSVGLDTERLKADMKSPEIDKIIEDNHSLAQAMQINGTPAMVIADTFVPGAVPKERMWQLIASARK